MSLAYHLRRRASLKERCVQKETDHLTLGDGIAMSVAFLLTFLLNPLGWIALLIVAALIKWVIS